MTQGVQQHTEGCREAEFAVCAVAVVLAATALVAAAWQGYAKLPPGHATPE